MPVKIILDSNFLIIQPQFHLNISKELEKVINRKVKGIIISPVYEELLRLSKDKGGKERKKALMALQFIEDFDIVNVERRRNENVDDLIIRLAIEWNCPVATNDRVLRRKLRDMRVAVIYLRQKSRLEVEGEIT